MKPLCVFLTCILSALATSALASPEPSNVFTFGDGTNSNKHIRAKKQAGPVNPEIMYDALSSSWKFSNDGVTFNAFSGGFTLNVQGSPTIAGAAQLIPGAYVSLSQAGNNITVAAKITPWVDDSASFDIAARYGSGASLSMFSRRVGDTLEFRGLLLCGSSASSTASEGYISLVGYTINSSKVYAGTNLYALGMAYIAPTADSNTPIGSNNRTHGVYLDGTNFDRFFMTQFMTAGAFNPISPNAVCSGATGTNVMIMGSLPITQFNN